MFEVSQAGLELATKNKIKMKMKHNNKLAQHNVDISKLKLIQCSREYTTEETQRKKMNECNLVSILSLSHYLFLEIISCNFSYRSLFSYPSNVAVLIQFIYLFSFFSTFLSCTLFEASCFTSQQNTTTTEMETKI